MTLTRQLAISVLIACTAAGPSHAAAQESTGDPAARNPPAQPEGIALALPADPDVVMGRLSNGLRFVIARGPDPENDSDRNLALLLHFAAGSAYESDDQIGAARMAADLAATGALSPDREAFLRSFTALGVDPQRAIRSNASYTATRFVLSVPIDKDHGLSSADVARAVEAMSGLLAPAQVAIGPEDLAGARHELLSSQNAWSGPAQRITSRALPQMFGDSVFAQRVPIYSAESVDATSTQALSAFVSSWYTPQRATLVVVGPADPGVVRRAIERAFGPIEAGAAADEPNLSVARPKEGAILVENDPGVAGDVVQLMLLEGSGRPINCTDALRERITESVAMVALNRRLQELSRSGDAAALQAGAFTNPDAGGYRMTMLSVAGAPGEWARLTREAVASIHSAQNFGFTAREISAAKDRVRQSIDAEFARAAERSSVSLATELATKVQRGDTIVNAQTYRQAALTSLSMIDRADLDRTMARVFEIDALATLVVTGAPGADPVQVRQQIDIARTLDAQAVARASPMPAEQPLFGPIPGGGRASDLRFDPQHEVTSATLPSGVRLHHRSMKPGGGRIEIAAAIALPGAAHTPTARAELDAIGSLDWQPATTEHSSRRIAQALNAHDVDFDVDLTPQAIVFELSTSPEEFRFAMQLLAAMLRSAHVEPAAIERWRVDELQRIAEADSEPTRAALRVFEQRIAPRTGEAAPDQDEAAIRAVRASAVQDRLNELLRTAPLSVAITGDIDRAEALQVGAALLGDLSPRNPSSTEGLVARSRPAVEGPFDIRLEQELGGSVGAVVVGFLGADATQTADAAALDVAASILEDRLRERLRTERVGGAALSVWSIDADGPDEHGRFWARAIVSPDQADSAAAIIEEELTRLREHGPTDSEVSGVVRRQTRFWTRRAKSLSAWAEALALNESLAGEPVRILRDRAEGAIVVDAASVQDALSRFSTAERSFRIVVLPRSNP